MRKAGGEILKQQNRIVGGDRRWKLEN